MSTLEVIIVAVVLLVILLAIGGMLVVDRRRREGEAGFDASLDEVNQQLAAARRAFAEQRVADEIREEALIAVIDRPGTDDDRAVFRFVTDAGTFLLTMGRQGGHWAAVSVERAET